MFTRVLAVLVVGLLVLSVWTGYQALQVKEGLETVAVEVDPAIQDIEAGDADALRDRLATVQDGAAQAARNSRGPGWWLAGRLPAVGDDVRAIQTVSDVSDQLASGVLPQVARATTVVANTDPYAGPAAARDLAGAARQLVRADRRLQRQEQRVAAIEVAGLDPRLADPVERLQVALAAAADFLADKRAEGQQALDAVPAL